ncbi:MAG: CinA family protein [Cytophagaceae bacterium]|jgi:PncC family amidohydrolase|nr:CinA family protein [Cytophagaceae bacterium]
MNIAIKTTGDELPQALLLNQLRSKHATISCAESCTGGYIAHLITLVAGASDCFNGGVVAYSNQIKKKLLNVSDDDLLQHGAVSQQVVEQMALGACTTLGSNYAIATSGIAGPAGGTPEKPVGTVWIAWAGNNKVVSECFHFSNSREQTIASAAETAIIRMNMMLKDEFLCD